MSLFPKFTTIITTRSLLFSFPLSNQQHLCVRSVYQRFFNNFCLHTQCAFTQGWLNYYCLLPALSCPFICASDQSNECSFSRLLKNSIATTLLFVYTMLFVGSHTCLSLFLSYCCCWFTWFTAFICVVVCVAFVHNFKC